MGGLESSIQIRAAWTGVLHINRSLTVTGIEAEELSWWTNGDINQNALGVNICVWRECYVTCISASVTRKASYSKQIWAMSTINTDYVATEYNTLSPYAFCFCLRPGSNINLSLRVTTAPQSILNHTLLEARNCFQAVGVWVSKRGVGRMFTSIFNRCLEL